MSLSEEQKKLIIQNIPSTFTIENKTIKASVLYANQMTEALYPSITLLYDTIGGKIYRPPHNRLAKDYEYSTNSSETFTATSDYTYENLLSTADISDVSIEGIVGGLPHTFAESEYSIDHSSITFIGVKPDEGTDFTVSYTEYNHLLRLGAFVYDLIIIDVHCDKRHNGVNGSKVASHMAQRVRDWFAYELQDLFEENNENLVVLDVSDEIKNLDELIQSFMYPRRNFSATIANLEYVDVIKPRLLETEYETEVAI